MICDFIEEMQQWVLMYEEVVLELILKRRRQYRRSLGSRRRRSRCGGREHGTLR
jgi:hypothetical protein